MSQPPATPTQSASAEEIRNAPKLNLNRLFVYNLNTRKGGNVDEVNEVYYFDLTDLDFLRPERWWPCPLVRVSGVKLVASSSLSESMRFSFGLGLDGLLLPPPAFSSSGM